MKLNSQNRIDHSFSAMDIDGWHAR